MARWSRERQCNRRERAAQSAKIGDDLSPQAVQEAGAREARLQRRFPDDPDVIRSTALGNALTAMETRAGQQYGWDAVVTWPRLYPLLSPGVRAVVDGQRDRLDALARLAMTSAATALLTVALLSGSGWWVLVAAIPAVVARLAYVGAVHSAMSYGEAVTVAFDLHRFDLLTQLHLPLPADIGQECKIASQVSRMWRQGVPLALSYDHGPAPEAGREPPGGHALHATEPRRHRRGGAHGDADRPAGGKPTTTAGTGHRHRKQGHKRPDPRLPCARSVISASLGKRPGRSSRPGILGAAPRRLPGSRSSSSRPPAQRPPPASLRDRPRRALARPPLSTDRRLSGRRGKTTQMEVDVDVVRRVVGAVPGQLGALTAHLQGVPVGEGHLRHRPGRRRAVAAAGLLRAGSGPRPRRTARPRRRGRRGGGE